VLRSASANHGPDRIIRGYLLPAPSKIAEISVTARFLMIAKDLIPGMGTKPFAITKGDR
jgi:hypothetical protein